MHKINIHLLITLLMIYLIKSDRPEDYKCTGNHQLKVGEEVVLCIHILDRSKNHRNRMAIKVIADEYSVVSLDGTHSKFFDARGNVEFLAQIGNVTSVFTSVSLNII